MKHFATLTFFLLSLSLVFSQNLVPNPGFEDYNDCPTLDNQFQKLEHWEGLAAPDYFNCSFYKTSQGSRTGSAYVGLSAHDDAWAGGSYRDYLTVELEEVLKAGQTYLVSYYAMPSSKSCKASDGLGALLTIEKPISFSSSLLPTQAQVLSPASFAPVDTLNWRLVSGTYLALGGEKFVTIGSFRSDAQSHMPAIQVCQGHSESYYHIDDVCISNINNNVCDRPLDLSGVWLNGRAIGRDVFLSWELSTSDFDGPVSIEHAFETGAFQEIAPVLPEKVVGVYAHFKFAARRPASGLNYYRVKVEHPSGDVSYSNVLSLRIDQADRSAIEVQYDSELRALKMRHSDLRLTELWVDVMDFMGKTISSDLVQSDGLGNFLHSLPVISRGYYILRIRDKGFGWPIYTKKMYLFN